MTNDVSMFGSLTKVTKITKRFRFPLLPLLVRGEVGAIPIAPGEVQRQHTREVYSCTEASVVGAA
jgi:hypothetical protein